MLHEVKMTVLLDDTKLPEGLNLEDTADSLYYALINTGNIQYEPTYETNEVPSSTESDYTKLELEGPPSAPVKNYRVGQDEDGAFQDDGEVYTSYGDAVLAAECLANWYAQDEEVGYVVERLASGNSWSVSRETSLNAKFKIFIVSSN